MGKKAEQELRDEIALLRGAVTKDDICVNDNGATAIRPPSETSCEDERCIKNH